MTGATVGERFADVLPTCDVAVVEGAGHFPWVDQPDRFRDAVEGFLSR
jgi:pimeloyl-ACP methyl ester carboxylesterase